MPEGDSIHAMVFRALRGNQLVVASSDTIKRAIEKGEPITAGPELSIEAAIDKLFEQRRTKAREVASKLLPCPVPETPILYLYDQIRQCILFDMNGAAITFCGILIEYALKYATFLKETGGRSTFDSVMWEEFEGMTLVPTIFRAKKTGLISNEEEKQLREFAKELRNRYSHFNIQKITEGVVFDSVTERNIETGQTQIVELSASRTPTLQIIAKEKLDEMTVLNIFDFCDKVVGSLFARLPVKQEGT